MSKAFLFDKIVLLEGGVGLARGGENYDEDEDDQEVKSLKVGEDLGGVNLGLGGSTFFHSSVSFPTLFLRPP